MPQGDQTGPNGMGPMTGRRMGFCAGFDVLGYMNPRFGRGLGRGFRRGFGRGFGFRAGFYPQIIQPQVITEDEEKNLLQDELKALKEEMQEIEKRLKELKSK